jgi:hypothetical protein
MCDVQCESLEVVQRRLKEMGIRYEHRRVEEGGIYVDQLFFHDPDGFMIEVCTCDNLPVVPLVPAPPCKRAAAAFKQQFTAPVAMADPAPAKATGCGCVHEVVDVPVAACATMTCPEQACMQV